MWSLVGDFMDEYVVPVWQEVRPFFYTSIGLVTIVLVLSSAFVGCTASQRQMFKDGAVTTADCALHSSLGCATQALAACQLPPLDGGDWQGYSKCVGESSLACQTAAMARCLMLGISRAAGGAPTASGGLGCSHMTEDINACIGGLDCETEAECVQGVAYCYRTICTQGE